MAAEHVTFTMRTDADRYRRAVQQALGKTYPIPGVRRGRQLPPGQGETLRYVGLEPIATGFAVQVTQEMVRLDGRVEPVTEQTTQRVAGKDVLVDVVTDVTINTATRRELLDGERTAAVEETIEPVRVR